MSWQIIPITDDPNQTLQTTIEVNDENIVLSFFFVYNAQCEYWTAQIKGSDGVILIDGLPLITINDLLEQYSYLAIGSAYIINVSGVDKDYPDETGWDKDFILLWGDNI